MVGTSVTSDDPLDSSILRSGLAETISLTLMRDGKEIDLSVTLGTRPAGRSR